MPPKLPATKSGNSVMNTPDRKWGLLRITLTMRSNYATRSDRFVGQVIGAEIPESVATSDHLDNRAQEAGNQGLEAQIAEILEDWSSRR